MHNTLVARGNADRKERAQAAPANGGGTTPRGTAPISAPLRAAFAGALTLTPHYNTCVHNTLVARGNAGHEERTQAAPAKGDGTTPKGTAPISAPLRAAFAGALTLTPHYNTCVHNTLVARGNADREERAQAAPAKGGGTTPKGPHPKSR
ncbi:hypothetical protein [Halomonas alkaliantarctica]|uniref:hypothetical protein n=1 Tax=Halomonas alkaliantarctica TaxID=232346 RepID=UPI00265930EC|nr:hypothetical protein [Halomonas alkaliantarctica]